jgi:hypothetical protein
MACERNWRGPTPTYVSLRKILNPIGKRATDDVVAEPYGEGSHTILYRAADVPSVPTQCAPIIGDVLYNLRSALDHFAWQLLRLDGQVPDAKHNPQFPIKDTALNGKGRPRHITIQPGIRDQRILDALTAVQPYEMLAKYGQPLWGQTLWLVNELCNADKHREPLAIIPRLDAHPPNLPWWEGDGVVHFEFTAKSLVLGDIVAKFDFGATVPNPDFDPHITLAVTLDEGPARCWPREESVFKFLSGLRHMLAVELNFRFVPLFSGEPYFDFGPQF